MIRYRRSGKDRGLSLSIANLRFMTHQRYAPAGVATGAYFHQDLWAARIVHQRGIRELTDVGSRIDGFVAHVLPFCRVTYVDIRRPEGNVDGMTFIRGNATALPFPDESLKTLSCLHVIEHIGLGRYGDEVDPLGHARAAVEIARVLAPGGILILGTPVGRERLCFDAHRIFDPQTVVELFPDLVLKQFSLIDDAGLRVRRDATFEDARGCRMGCGLFVFEKEQRRDDRESLS